MAAINSPNMSLPVPTVGSQPGPDYAFNVNQSLTLIDSHDHSTGKGVPITPGGMNINAAVNFNSNSALNINDLSLVEQTSSTTLQALYVAPGGEVPSINDLWFNDGAGNAIQITKAGLVNATIGSLAGQSYAGGTFIWKQGAGSTTPANFDIGSIILRPNTAATTYGVTLGPPSGIASSFDIALPELPGAQAVVTIDDTGTMDTVTYPLAAGSLAANSVTTTKIANGNVTLAKLSALNVVADNIPSFTVPSTGGQWYALSNNKVTLGAGTWRLFGAVNWVSSGNVASDLRIGWFGANGANSASTPSALSPSSTTCGILGEVKARSVQTVSMVNSLENAPVTIIVLTGSTDVYLNAFSSTTGASMQLTGYIAAEQLR